MKGCSRAAAALASLKNRLGGNGVLLQNLREELQRYLALQGGVLGEVDLTHPSLTDLFENLIVADRFTDHPLPPDSEVAPESNSGKDSSLW